MKKYLLPFLVVLALGVVACTPAAPEATEAPEEPEVVEEPAAVEEPAVELTDDIGFVEIAAGEPIRLAAMLTVSGATEFLGADSLGGIEIAIDERGQILGHDIELTVEDSGCSAEGGQTAAQRVASDPTIVAVIGTNCSSAMTAAIGTLSEAGLTMMSPTNTAPALTDPDGTWQEGYFRTAHNDKRQGSLAAEYAYNELGARTLATIHDGSPYADQLQQVMAARFEELGGTVTFQGAVNVGDTDMRSILTTIAADSPDVLYFPIFQPEGDFIAAQSSEIDGLENTVLFGADGLLVNSFAPAAGPNSEGMYLSGPYVSEDLPAYAAFLETYAANTGGPPPAGFAAHAYDGTRILLDAIEAVAVESDGGIKIGRQALRDAVAATSGYDGLTGVLDCGEKQFGDVTHVGDCATGEALGIFQLTAAQVASADNWPAPVVYTPTTGTSVLTTADECAVDLSGEQIVIYQQAGTEGPIASILGLAFQFATSQAVEDINAAGGICGAELAVEFFETGYDVEQEVVAYETFRAADPRPFVINTYNSGATVALAERFDEDQIVAIAAGVNTGAIYGRRSTATSYTIGVVPVYADQFAGMCQFLADNWADVKPASAGDDIIIGVIGWVGAYGSGATTPEAIAYCEGLGITVLEKEEQTPSPDYDSTGNIQALVAQGANVIYQQNLSFSTAEVVATATALGIRDDVLMAGVSWSGNTDVLNFLGDNVGLMEGVIVPTPYVTWDNVDHPGIQQVAAAFDASGAPPNERTFTFLLTYAGFYNQAEVIQHAINTTGWPVSGEDFLTAFQSLSPVNALGVLEWTAAGEQRSPDKTTFSQFQSDGAGGVTLVEISDVVALPQAWPEG